MPKTASAGKTANPWGKKRPKENPYAIYRGNGWEWRVLKAYQSPGKELNNPFARWHCFVTSPMLPDGECGDVYVNEIVGQAVKVEDVAVATCQSYAPEVIADDSGKWAGNALRFATREEAKAWVEDLRCRWFLVREVRVVESNEPVNSKYPKE